MLVVAASSKPSHPPDAAVVAECAAGGAPVWGQVIRLFHAHARRQQRPHHPPHALHLQKPAGCSEFYVPSMLVAMSASNRREQAFLPRCHVLTVEGWAAQLIAEWNEGRKIWGGTGA